LSLLLKDLARLVSATLVAATFSLFIYPWYEQSQIEEN
jgi:hypothetical protein